MFVDGWCVEFLSRLLSSVDFASEVGYLAVLAISAAEHRL